MTKLTAAGSILIYLLSKKDGCLVARARTVALHGIDVLDVDVQVQMSSGLPSFTIVGLPDKAVAESRERIRAALHAIGLALPLQRITINLSPADLQKEGSHFDLPIALALLVEMGVLPSDSTAGMIALGELALDGAVMPVAGVLPAAMHAANLEHGLICPAACGGEASWVSTLNVLPVACLMAFINHATGQKVLDPAQSLDSVPEPVYPDMAHVQGQILARRALEVAAAGGHNILMQGPPGAGKSMLASRLPGLLPALSARESLEVTMIYSVAGLLKGQSIIRHRPYREPHHSASQAALVGGGMKARPGEISLAHHGVLFLDELPEFSRSSLEALRQPLESGSVTVARAHASLTYPARAQIIAAMNPCRCGYLGDQEKSCSRAPTCGEDYRLKLSGPLLDRIDILMDVPAVPVKELMTHRLEESSVAIAKRVKQARLRQEDRCRTVASADESGALQTSYNNATMPLEVLFSQSTIEIDAQQLLEKAVEHFRLSARGYHRVLRLARTIADLDQSDQIKQIHVAEAVSYRQDRRATAVQPRLSQL